MLTLHVLSLNTLKLQIKQMLHVKSFTNNPFSENTYLVYNDAKQGIIIDPGMYSPAEEKIVFDFIAQNNIVPTQIINTHCHLDHIFGIHACINQYHIPFSFHALEQQIYDWAPQAGLKYGVPVLHSPPPNFYINAGDIIKLGNDEMHILFCPGHSPGHVCFYSAADSFVIAGDVIFQNSIGRTDLPGGDLETLLQSIHREILSLPPETIIYNGHGNRTYAGIEKMNNPYLR
jgi:hydroxyacylglutathione hydrolase